MNPSLEITASEPSTQPVNQEINQAAVLQAALYAYEQSDIPFTLDFVDFAFAFKSNPEAWKTATDAFDLGDEEDNVMLALGFGVVAGIAYASITGMTLTPPAALPAKNSPMPSKVDEQLREVSSKLERAAVSEKSLAKRKRLSAAAGGALRMMASERCDDSKRVFLSGYRSVLRENRPKRS